MEIKQQYCVWAPDEIQSAAVFSVQFFEKKKQKLNWTEVGSVPDVYYKSGGTHEISYIHSESTEDGLSLNSSQ